MKTRNVRRRQIARYERYLCHIPAGGGRGNVRATPQMERERNRAAAVWNRCQHRQELIAAINAIVLDGNWYPAQGSAS